ncbi:MAG: mechanosensitive ion channel family protein [Niabella sp.]
MNEFLHHIYWDNSLMSYLIVAAIIIAGFLFKRYIAHYIASFLFLLLRSRYKHIEKDAFKNLIAKPLGLFIAIFITVIALDRLTFPQQLDFSIYHLKLKELLRMTGTALLIIAFFRSLIKNIDFITLLIKDKYLQSGDPGNHQLVFFFKDFIKVIVGGIGVLFLLKYVFNYPINNLVTGLSIVGAAIALALKESLENLIASFIIFFDKPFQTGDAVKGNNFSGTVEKIGLRSTRIRTDAKTYVTVPNKQMVDSVVDNLSNRTQRRADIRLEISVDTPSDKVTALLEGIKKILGNPDIKDFNLYLNDIAPNALIITSDYYTDPGNIALFNVTRQNVNLKILKLMEDLGIDMSGKTTSVSLVSQPQQPDTANNTTAQPTQ